MSRIFLAGAAAVVGGRLTSLLLAHGHSVWGTTRSPHKSNVLRELGARPVVVDIFDTEALAAAVLEAEPEIVIHQLTDLPVLHDPAVRSAALPVMRESGTKELATSSPRGGRLARAD